MLTEDQVAQFKKDGFLLGGKVLSDEKVEQLNEEVARVIRDRDSGGRQPVLCHNFAKSQGQTVWQIVNIWEASDAFTRYRDPAFAERGVQVQEVDGVLRYVLDGAVFAVLPGPGDVHPRPRPGSFMDYFSGKLTRQEFMASFNEPPSEHPEWYRRDARLSWWQLYSDR